MGLLLPSLTFVILTLNVELAAVETNEDQVAQRGQTPECISEQHVILCDSSC